MYTDATNSLYYLSTIRAMLAPIFPHDLATSRILKVDNLAVANSFDAKYWKSMTFLVEYSEFHLQVHSDIRVAQK